MRPEMIFGDAVRRNSKLWIPSIGEERYLSLIAAALVVMLLAPGFEILKLLFLH